MSTTHIGKLIRAQIEAKGMSKSEFARRINTSPQNAHGIFKRQSVDTELLMRVSTVLDYDFFQHLLISEPHPLKAHEPKPVYKKGQQSTVSQTCEEQLKQAQTEISYLKKINELQEARINSLLK